MTSPFNDKFGDMNIDSEQSNDTSVSVSSKSEVYLQITEQPVSKFRFRYKTEIEAGHGQLKGESGKTVPAVKLVGYNGEAVILCSLYQIKAPLLHAHSLLDRAKDSLSMLQIVNAENEFEAKFSGMAIVLAKKTEDLKQTIENNCTQLKFILGKETLTEIEILKIQNDCKLQLKNLGLHWKKVRLCFEAFKLNENGSYIKLCDPIFSKDIEHHVAVKMKIHHLNISSGSAKGEEQLILLTDKIDKDKIQVRFFELNDDEERIWNAKALSQLNHKSFALIITTPAYHNPNITEEVEVFIELYDPESKTSSEPCKFTYKPYLAGSSRKRVKPQSLECINSFKASNSVESNQSLGTKNKDELPIVEENYSAPGIDTTAQTIFSISKLPGHFEDHQNKNHVIHKYISDGRIRDAKLLVKIAAIHDRNALQLQDKNGDSYLHTACNFEYPELIPHLLRAGVNPNLQNNDGNTVLHAGVIKNNEKGNEIVREIIKSFESIFCNSLELDLNLENNMGLTPCHVAIRNANLDAIKILNGFKNTNTIVHDLTKIDMLHFAKKEGNEEIVSFFEKEIYTDDMLCSHNLSC